MGFKYKVPIWIKRVCDIDSFGDDFIYKIPIDTKSNIANIDDSQILVTSNNLNYTLNPLIFDYLQKNFPKLFPIQRAVIPHLLFDLYDNLSPNRSDVIVCAPTGQGKTLCYVIPVLNYLSLRNIYSNSVCSIVVTPTRELTHQVESVFNDVIKYLTERDCSTKIKVMKCAGKFNMKDFERKTKHHSPNVLISTFGMIDVFSKYIENVRNSIFNNVKWIIIDEVDIVLQRYSSDFVKFLTTISNQYNSNKFSFINCFPRNAQRVFLSATMSITSDLVMNFELRNPLMFVSLSLNIFLSPELQQFYILSNVENRSRQLIHFLHSFIFDSDRKNYKLLIFCNTVKISHLIARLLQLYNKIFLKGFTFNVLEYTRNLSVKTRDNLISSFRESKRVCLVCSDVMARGLDFPDVSCVVNYGQPRDIQAYIHRVGRTARAGRAGIAVTIASKNWVDSMNKQLAASRCSMKNFELSENFQELTKSNKYAKLMKRLDACLQDEIAGNITLDEKID